MAVDVDDGEPFSAGPPHVVVEDTGTRCVTAIAPAVNWDVSPDGRFEFVEFERHEKAGSQVELALNWAQNLELGTP